jgi:hypothetical protein
MAMEVNNLKGRVGSMVPSESKLDDMVSKYVKLPPPKPENPYDEEESSSSPSDRYGHSIRASHHRRWRFRP